LRRQRDELDSAIAGGDTSKISELNNLEQRIQALESTYSNLLIETGRARSSFDTATILDSASAARTITTTPRYQSVVGGLLGGLVAAAALAFLLEQLDHRMRSPSDIVSVTSTAPASVIGRISTRKWPKEVRRTGLVTVYDSHTPAAEAFRTLRTTLRFKALKNPFKSLIVTSSLEGEGKTIVAANLAVTLAKAGSRVLLIDADFRRPELHQVFGVQREHGIMEALSEHESTRRAHPLTPIAVSAPAPFHSEDGSLSPLQHSTSAQHPSQAAAASAHSQASIAKPFETGGLYVLPVSHPVHDPTPLLGSENFVSFIKEQEEYWDYVIVDTPPVGPVADALLVADATDGILVVARNLKTSRSALQRTLDALNQTGKPILGVVLNDYRADPLSKYTSSGYYYHYGSYYTSDGADDVAAGTPQRNGTRRA
jgi:Mrp family chromosome partitioning ATPase